MIEYRIAAEKEMDLLISSRLEMLREVNHLEEDYRFSDEFISESRRYFQDGDQSTVLAVCDGTVIGCATICFIRLMPTFAHPSGKRAHLMNVYTSEAYRRQGIAREMVTMLIEETWKRGVTEISLDATSSGRQLYMELGFTDSEEGMVLSRNDPSAGCCCKR